MNELNQNKEVYSEEDCVNVITLMTINDECDLLIGIATHFREPNFSNCSLPYHALFCVEVADRLKEMGIPFTSSCNGVFDIKATRTRLKLFNDKLGKVIKLINCIYQDQDQIFGSRLRYGWMRRRNMYYNMGIYFYKNKIIANTYYLISLFDKKDGHYDELNGNDVFDFARGIGRTLRSVSDISAGIQRNEPDLHDIDITVLYKDININRRKLFAIEGAESKFMGILMLNVLGNINFTLYLIEDIVGHNTWKLRSQYISMYYAKEMLMRVAERTDDFEIAKRISTRIDELNPIFNLCFRNCMMHYSYSQNGAILIREEYFDIEKPLFGLVESCFDGMSYDKLSDMVKGNLKMMGNLIESMMVMNFSKLKRF